MGVDYIRFHLKPEADPREIEALVRQQALAFQSMPGWCNGSSRVESLTCRMQEKLHRATYLEASARLESLIVVPDWDDERRCSPDIPELAPSWRVYPITHRSIFPPLWRVRAYRTILPEELSGQIAQWRTWLDEVQHGERDAIVHRLWLFSNSDWLRVHWGELRDVATHSLERTAAWAQKPELDEVRRQILMLPEPTVVDVPLDEFEPLPPLDEAAESVLREAIDRTCALTKSWNRLVRSNAKVRRGRSEYVPSLEEFKAQCCDDWLHEFLAWAQSCADRGFGLFLDY